MVFHSPQNEREVEGADMVIYSSAVKPGNVAYEAAFKQGIPLVRRAEALAAVMARKAGVVVAGTHGKTTTSSLTAHVLRRRRPESVALRRRGDSHPRHATPTGTRKASCSWRRATRATARW